jgi:transposase
VKITGVCPNCKYEVKLSLSDREFTCLLCNSTFYRDVASALVILKEGFACGTQARRPGMKRLCDSGILEKYFPSKLIDELGSHARKGGIVHK